MSLTAGSKLGPYEIVSSIGAGGMGEVFRARDPRLGREVAIKVLPAAFAQDAERVARFRREAQLLAALSHPNIAAIYGLEESNGVVALALELVEGDDLSQHLARGPIAIAEALPIARQIAEGLEAAHERGIVHRDLKPANVKIGRDGMVKILDFGLARAGESDPSTSDLSLANSPTMARPMTEAGMILGTAAYMSPEQARGRSVDKRSDVWSFGVVLYEMLTGRRLFTGETVSDVLAAVLTRDPEWSVLGDDVPPRVRALLQRCLERDPKLRLRDIGEARVELSRPDLASTDATPRQSSSRRRDLMTGFAAGLVLFLTLAAWTLWRKPHSDARLLRLAFLPPENIAFDPGGFHFAVISPDGQKIVYSGRGADGKRQLWVSRLDGLDAQLVPDSFEGLEPFWSPDSASVGFGSQGKLKIANLSATRATVLCDAPRLNVGAVWGAGGVILFVPDYGAGLHRVSASGGSEQVVVPAAQNDARQPRYVSFLPDGRRFLYCENAPGGKVFAASIDSSEVTEVPGAKSPAVFAPPGWLLTEVSGDLAAQPFDAERLRATGDPIPLSIPVSDDGSRGRFTVSDNGVLLQQRSRPQSTQLLWLDREGKRLGAVGGAADTVVSRNPMLSPDGTLIAVQLREGDVHNQDIWVIDAARGTGNRLTTDPSLDQFPIWSADGATVYFNARRNGISGIYEVPVRGGQERMILEGVIWPVAATADGRYLLYYKRGERSLTDVWALPLSGGGKPFPVLASIFEDWSPDVSGDGRMIAWSGRLTGTFEIYVAPLTADLKVGPITRVTTSGGRIPRWRRDGRELFFLSGSENPERELLSSVDVRMDGTETQVGTPRALFEVRAAPFVSTRSPYCVSADGQKFLFDASAGPTVQPAVRVFVNWQAALRAPQP